MLKITQPDNQLCSLICFLVLKCSHQNIYLIKNQKKKGWPSWTDLRPSRLERANLRYERADLRSERPDLRSERAGPIPAPMPQSWP